MSKRGQPSLPKWAANIRDLRDVLRTNDLRRVSQDALSELLIPYHPEKRSVGQSTVGKWENGQQEPTLGEFEALANLANALGLIDVTPWWLAFSAGEEPAYAKVRSRLPDAQYSNPSTSVSVPRPAAKGQRGKR